MTTKRTFESEAEERYNSYLNGNTAQLWKWIGNSANRLLAVYTVVVRSGSEEGRRFMDRIRYQRSL